MSHGGARAGAGRPRLTLGKLLAAGLDPGNPRHRRLLLKDPLPTGLPAELEELVRVYRRAQGIDRVFLSRRIARAVEEQHG